MKTTLAASNILVALTLLGCSAPDTSGVFRNNGRSIGHDFQTGGSGSGGSDGQGGDSSTSSSSTTGGTSSTGTNGSGGSGGSDSCDCSGMAHGITACVDGECKLQGCQPGYDNCDGNPTNGCEANLQDDSTCGTCGNSCGNGSQCQGSPDPEDSTCTCPNAPTSTNPEVTSCLTCSEGACCDKWVACQNDSACSKDLQTWESCVKENGTLGCTFGDGFNDAKWSALRTCVMPTGCACGS